MVLWVSILIPVLFPKSKDLRLQMSPMNGSDLNKFILGLMQKFDRKEGSAVPWKHMFRVLVLETTFSLFVYSEFWFFKTGVAFWNNMMLRSRPWTTALLHILFVKQHSVSYWGSTRSGQPGYGWYKISMFFMNTFHSGPLHELSRFSKANSIGPFCCVSKVHRLAHGLESNSLPTDMRKYNGKQMGQKGASVDGFMAFCYWNLAPGQDFNKGLLLPPDQCFRIFNHECNNLSHACPWGRATSRNCPNRRDLWRCHLCIWPFCPKHFGKYYYGSFSSFRFGV